MSWRSCYAAALPLTLAGCDVYQTVITNRPTAGRRTIAGAIGTVLPNALVPKSLRNGSADLVSDKLFGSAMDAATLKSDCSRFGN